VIGTNDGAGWGKSASARIIAGHITWNRVEIGGSNPNTMQASLAAGFKVLGIVGNVPDGNPLSQYSPASWGAQVASQVKANPAISIAEAGNEMYLKGGQANPVQYGRMYLAAVEALGKAGIHTTLLFNLTGDYPFGIWTQPQGWSTDAAGGGWLQDAVKAVPGLANAIAANGVSIHPYGGVHENVHDDTGIASAAALEGVARSVLGSIPPFYVTEVGYDLARCGPSVGACSPKQQAEEMRQAYEVLVSDANIDGIWWYQSHDETTGRWGFMHDSGAVRPSFKVLSSIAEAAGQ
jgi:hypothetical protein